MSLSAETLAAWAASKKSQPDVELTKAFTVSSGLVQYDLEAVAKTLFPVITPLRNMIPRVKGDGGSATHWKAITGIDTASLSIGLAEGGRAGIPSTTVKSYTAAYVTIGMEDTVTFEAQEAGEGFDDVRALATTNLLRALMIGEENMILGGNATVLLGQASTPVLADVATGGAIPQTTTVYVLCVPLTHEGYRTASVTATVGIKASVTRTNADATTTTFGGYSGQISTDQNVTTATDGLATHSIKTSVTPIAGAAGYAWFWGASAAVATLGAITTIASYLITTAAGTGTQVKSTTFNADNSLNAYSFDGIISIVAGAGPYDGGGASGALLSCQAQGVAGTGTPLTSDGAGGIVEINADLKSFWDNYKISPSEIFVNAQELGNITYKVIAAGGTPLFRFVSDAVRDKVQQGTITAGAIVGFYLNKYTMDGGQHVAIRLHPNVAPGMIIYYSREITYPLSNVRNVMQVKERRGYYSIEWPLVSRKYVTGTYASEVLQCYFPPAFGMRYNIANG